MEAPKRSNIDLWVGLQQMEGCTYPSFSGPSPILSPQLAATPGMIDRARTAPPPPESIPGEPNIRDFLAGRRKDKIIARYGSEQE